MALKKRSLANLSSIFGLKSFLVNLIWIEIFFSLFYMRCSISLLILVSSVYYSGLCEANVKLMFHLE